MKKILTLIVTGVMASVTSVMGMSDFLLHEPESDDPTMEFPLFVVADDDSNVVFESLVSVIEQNGIETFVIGLQSCPEDAELEELLSTFQVDADRVYIVTRSEGCSSSIYAGRLTPGEDGTVDSEAIMTVLEQTRSY